MSLIQPPERPFLEAVSKLCDCNPFTPERVVFEREALGEEFCDDDPVWSLRVEDPDHVRENAGRIAVRAERIAEGLRGRLAAGETPADGELRLYEDAVFYLLYYRHGTSLDLTKLMPELPPEPVGHAAVYSDFLRSWRYYIGPAGDRASLSPEHVFALFFQILRAFYGIFTYIIGSSPASARLRAAVWNSIFTHDLRRYRHGLYDRMGDFTTLITGPSGTGKELIARAVALSRYMPFHPRRSSFEHLDDRLFYPVNLAALSPALIESELFGHRRGAFTGATHDRAGWLEECPNLGTVFLDEIGELDPTLQVKLLRVLESRTFQRVGETDDRTFTGKIVAATNRDLGAAMQQGGFREDLYYRLCSDRVETTPLADQLAESPEVLDELVLYMARRVAGDAADAVAGESLAFIRTKLGPDYRWPGNYRELEQCVRNIVVRGAYQPPTLRRDDGRELFPGLRDGELTLAELTSRYCTLVYSQTQNYEEAARRLEMDRRTVKSKVDAELLRRLLG